MASGEDPNAWKKDAAVRGIDMEVAAMLKENPEVAPVAKHETSLADARRAIKKQFRKGRLFGEFEDHPLQPFLQARQLEGSERTIDEVNRAKAGLSEENRDRIARLSRDAAPE